MKITMTNAIMAVGLTLLAIVGIGVWMRIPLAPAVAPEAPAPPPEDALALGARTGAPLDVTEAEAGRLFRMDPSKKNTDNYRQWLGAITSANDQVRCLAAFRVLKDEQQDAWQKYGRREDDAVLRMEKLRDVYKCGSWMDSK